MCVPYFRGNPEFFQTLRGVCHQKRPEKETIDLYACIRMCPLSEDVRVLPREGGRGQGRAGNFAVYHVLYLFLKVHFSVKDRSWRGTAGVGKKVPKSWCGPGGAETHGLILT